MYTNIKFSTHKKNIQKKVAGNSTETNTKSPSSIVDTTKDTQKKGQESEEKKRNPPKLDQRDSCSAKYL